MEEQESVRKEDIWTNGVSTFRVDMVTPVGGVSIRFRTDARLDGNASLIQKLLGMLKGSSVVPSGEWFFGSIAEFQQFVQGNGYTLEKRMEKSAEAKHEEEASHERGVAV